MTIFCFHKFFVKRSASIRLTPSWVPMVSTSERIHCNARISLITLSCRITPAFHLNQSIPKPKTLDISTLLLMFFSFPCFLTKTRSSARATTYAKSSKEKEKPGDWAGNRMKREVWVEMSGVLGFEIDGFKSDARVILQYSIIPIVMNFKYFTVSQTPVKCRHKHVC